MKKTLIMFMLLVHKAIVASSIYYTPALYDQFANFVVTNSIPSNGSGSASSPQTPVDLGNNSVRFEFRGIGNALLLFQKDESANDYPDVFLVKVAGFPNNARVGIHVSKSTGASDEVAAIDINGLTNENEFRWFWTTWDPESGAVRIGNGITPNENELLSKTGVFSFNVTALSISTDSYNAGEWRFQTTSEDISTTIATSSVLNPATSTSLMTSANTTKVPTSTPLTSSPTTFTTVSSLSTSASTICLTATCGGATKSSPIFFSSTTVVISSSPNQNEEIGFFDKSENIAAVAVPCAMTAVGLATIIAYKSCQIKSSVANGV